MLHGTLIDTPGLVFFKRSLSQRIEPVLFEGTGLPKKKRLLILFLKVGNSINSIMVKSKKLIFLLPES